MTGNQDKGKNEADAPGKGGAPAVAPQDQTATPATPEYVTSEALESALNNFFDKRVQGFVDKRNNGLQERVKAQMDDLKKALDLAGVEVTAEQQAAMTQKVINQALLEDNQAPAQEPQAQAQQPQASTQALGDDADPIIATAYRLMDEAGITIEDEDPEVKLINNDGTDAEFITSLMSAIATKKERQAQTARDEAARVTPGISQGGKAGTYTGRKGLDLLSEAYKK